MEIHASVYSKYSARTFLNFMYIYVKLAVCVSVHVRCRIPVTCQRDVMCYESTPKEILGVFLQIVAVSGSWHRRLRSIFIGMHLTIFFFQIGIKSALVRAMVCRCTGDKPLPELMMAKFTDAYMSFLILVHSRRLFLSHTTASLTHWGRATHICVGKLTTIGSDNGLLPGRRQAIIWTIAGIVLIEPLGTNFSEILIGIQTFSFKKMHLKMSSAKWRPSCLGLNVLNVFCW